MTSTRGQIIRLGSAVGVLIIVLVINLMSSREKGQPPVPASTSTIAQDENPKISPTVAEPPPKALTTEMKTLIAQMGRPDPFMVTPSGGPIRLRKLVQSGEVVLEGIIMDGVERIAIVNDKIVREGEVVEGKRVLKIEKDRIILDDHGIHTTHFLGADVEADL